MAQQITLSIPTPGASYIAAPVSGPAGFSDSGTTDASGNVNTGQQYPPGEYTVDWSYQPASGPPVIRYNTFTVIAGQTVYPFPPLQISDPASGSVAASSASTAPSLANPSGAAPNAATLTPSPVALSTTPASAAAPVVTWPQYNYGKYFTPTQAFMYIGNVFIDELNSFQFTLQGNKIPVFGYSSSRMDALGTGKSLVQGQLTINFISEGYLYSVLNNFASMSAAPTPPDEQAAVNLASQYTLLASSGSSPAAKAQMTTIKQQLRQLVANNSNLPSVISSAAQSATVTGTNPVYSTVPFDIVFQFEGGGRTITRRIKKCVLTSNEMILGDSDSPVLEAYSFISREVI